MLYNYAKLFISFSSMVIAYNRPVTSISYRSWMSREVSNNPILLVNVAINLLCLYGSFSRKIVFDFLGSGLL